MDNKLENYLETIYLELFRDIATITQNQMEKQRATGLYRNMLQQQSTEGEVESIWKLKLEQ